MTSPTQERYIAGLQAIEQLKKIGLDPKAHNYAVWFSALTKEHPALAQTLNDIVAQKMPLSQERMDYLFATYVQDDGRAATVQETAQLARKLFAEVLLSIQHFTGASGEVGQQMQGTLNSLSDEPTAEELKALAEAIVQGASRLKLSGETLNARLSESQKEIEGLKTNLAKVTVESEKDFLTNLANRKTFDRRLQERIEEARAEGTDLVLLMLDVDHFKQFNDKFGHVIGDEVLKIVARSLTDTVKGMDTVARYGGEEFAVILPKTPIGGGMIVGEAVRKAIASKELKRRDTGDNYGVITVSVGVASFNRQHDTAESFIERADEALYRSKKAGRNRVTQENLSIKSGGGVVSKEAAAAAKTSA